MADYRLFEGYYSLKYQLFGVVLGYFTYDVNQDYAALENSLDWSLYRLIQWDFYNGNERRKSQ